MLGTTDQLLVLLNEVVLHLPESLLLDFDLILDLLVIEQVRIHLLVEYSFDR